MSAFFIKRVAWVSWLGVCFVVGIIWFAFLPVDLLAVYWLLLGFVLIGFLFRSDLFVRKLAFGLAMACLSCGYTIWRAQPGSNAQLVDYHGQKPVLQGYIAEAPKIGSEDIKYVVQIEQIELDSNWQTLQGRLLLQQEKYPAYEYLDEIKITGKIDTPPEHDDFSYQDYLGKRGIYSLAGKYTQVELIGNRGSYHLLRFIYRFKSQIESVVNRLLPEPESSLLNGLLLGIKNGFDQDFKQALATTGMSHIVSVSGYNISIVILLVKKITERFLSKKKQIWLIMLVLLLFVILSGASASVVRAGLLATMVGLAGRFGRFSRPTNSLVFVAWLMLFVNPQLLWDTGFQLSFLATGGIIWILPKITQSPWYKKNTRYPNGSELTKHQHVLASLKVYLFQTLALTLSAQVLILPLLISSFGQVSLISPLVNLLVVFMIPLAMASGAVATILGVVNYYLAVPLVAVSYIALHYLVWVIRLFARVPGAIWNFGNISPMVWLGWYLIVIWLINREPHKEQND